MCARAYTWVFVECARAFEELLVESIRGIDIIHPFMCRKERNDQVARVHPRVGVCGVRTRLWSY